MTRENEILGHRYTLTLQGVFGRNRKVKTEYVKLVSFSESLIDDTELEALARAAMVGSLKPKPGCVWRVERDNAGWQVDENGIVWVFVRMTIGGRADVRVSGVSS